MDQVVKLLTGSEGTEVELQVAREGTRGPITLRVKRARLEVPDVTWHMLPGTKVAHLAILSFGEHASEQLKEALRAAQARVLVN